MKSEPKVYKPAIAVRIVMKNRTLICLPRSKLCLKSARHRRA